MKQLSKFAGMVAFWLSWPALWVYLRWGGWRTRLLLVVDDHYLAVMPRLGTGRWELPGGGIKRGESNDQALLREVFEETGIKLNPADLRMLSQNVAKRYGLRFRYYCYFVELLKRPTLEPKHHLEVVDVSWQPLKSAADPGVSPEIQQAVQTWSKR